MSFQIKKLNGIFDDIIIWLRDNPKTPVDENTKLRLEKIVQLLHEKPIISEQEWREISPIKIQNSEVIIYRLTQRLKYTQSELKKLKEINVEKISLALRTEKVIDSSSNTNNEYEIKKVENKVIGKMDKIICPDCKVALFARNSLKHKNKCPEKRVNTIKKNKSLTAGDLRKKSNSFLDDYINNYSKINTERKLNVSDGLHNYRRENGRFGSLPLYDNMDENSQP